jgi:hypothetical protein
MNTAYPQTSSEEALRVQAEVLANTYAPYPRVEISQAAMLGAAASGIVLILFTGFAGISMETLSIAAAVTVALSGAVPGAFIWHQQDRHAKAVEKEWKRLTQEREFYARSVAEADRQKSIL